MVWTLLLNWRTWAILGYVALAGWGSIQTMRLDWAKSDFKTLQAQFDVFKAQVAQEGKAAQERADLQAKQDLQRQKDADNEAKKKYADLDAQYAQYRMRQRAGSGATSSLLPSASPNAGNSSKVCYSRDTADSEIKSSIGRLRDGIADDTEPYDKAVIVAMLCKTWAAGR